ncbi:MAG TPA: TlpA disulfide reductase family protein [Pyrinomonadaceae bacterium]|nr:TlpA disulfide reductase family protein [Pyrinomonadaceae bacterium]
MKDLFSSLALLIILTVAIFSPGCSSAQQAGSNAVPANPATKGDEKKISVYPPLASTLADAELELLDGAKTRISDRKGKVLLVNIWGIWCGPCRAEMPHLVELQDLYRDRGFEIVGMNIGDQNGSPEGVEAIKTFADKMKLNYTIVRSPGATTEQFYRITKQQVVPQTLLIDREGHLRGVFVGGGARVINSMKETLEKTMAEGA